MIEVSKVMEVVKRKDIEDYETWKHGVEDQHDFGHCWAFTHWNCCMNKELKEKLLASSDAAM